MISLLRACLKTTRTDRQRFGVLNILQNQAHIEIYTLFEAKSGCQIIGYQEAVFLNKLL